MQKRTCTVSARVDIRCILISTESRDRQPECRQQMVHTFIECKNISSRFFSQLFWNDLLRINNKLVWLVSGSRTFILNNYKNRVIVSLLYDMISCRFLFSPPDVRRTCNFPGSTWSCKISSCRSAGIFLYSIAAISFYRTRCVYMHFSGKVGTCIVRCLTKM